MPLILASASPRRCELLRLITEDFSVIPADGEECIPDGTAVEEAAEYLACRKAMQVAKNHPEDIVIGADTVVIFGERILGKPTDADDAKQMLTLLSGKTHKVITGCSVICGDKSLSFSVETQVEFYPLTVGEIDSYIRTGEPSDKAGSYGIQGKGGLFVKGINGDYFNVVGLPVARLRRMLNAFGFKGEL